MQFWDNARLTRDFDLPTETVLQGFQESRWFAASGDITDRMALFLTDPDGPVNAICAAPDFLELCALALDQESAGVHPRSSPQQVPVA